MISQTVYIALQNKPIQAFLIQYLQHHDIFAVTCEDTHHLFKRLQSMTPNLLFLELDHLELDYDEFFNTITSGHYANSMKIILLADALKPLNCNILDYVDHILDTPVDIGQLDEIVFSSNSHPKPDIGLWI